MNINYTVSKDSNRKYAQAIRSRIKELTSNECATEAHVHHMAEKYAEKHECIDCVLSLVHCELTFWDAQVTVHMIAYCGLNNVPSAEVFGFCEMYFNYDRYDENGAIVKVYKLNYCHD